MGGTSTKHLHIVLAVEDEARSQDDFGIWCVHPEDYCSETRIEFQAGPRSSKLISNMTLVEGVVVGTTEEVLKCLGALSYVGPCTGGPDYATNWTTVAIAGLRRCGLLKKLPFEHGHDGKRLYVASVRSESPYFIR